MRKVILTSISILSFAALAQRVEDYRNAAITCSLTEYRPLIDGGTEIRSCCKAISQDGGFILDKCTGNLTGRTFAQRTAMSNCLDNGEKAFALDSNIRTDSGF